MIKLAKIKTYIKYCCGKTLGKVLEHELEHEIRKAEVVSFDLFDTLIKRNVARPEDVHMLVQKQFFEQTGTEIPGYCRLRTDAESKARKRSSQEEISLDDIFNSLCGIPEEWKARLKILEKQAEIEVCTPDLKMRRVYDQAVRDGKKIIITSDMYLDEQTIRQILYKCGYDFYEKLYLSSSARLSKSKGSIYETIKKDYAGYVGEILHIGDNVKGDYYSAKRKGINAVLIDGQPEYLKFWKKRNKNVNHPFLYQRLRCFLNNSIDCDRGDVFSIGFEILGPMLLGYCKWLYEKIRADRIDRIFFLSREGRILQEAFNILYPQCGIEQAYLYVSRQALTVPQLADAADFDEMEEVFRRVAHVSLLDMIPVICMLDPAVFNEKLNGIGLDGGTRTDQVPDEKKNELYHIIQELCKHDFEQQKEYTVRYLKEKNFAGNVAIADIGWSGTMQWALQKYVENTDIKLQGYYLGVRNMETDSFYAGLLRNGYLFEPKRNENYNLMTRFTAEIIELLFLNTTGSVMRYNRERGHIVPVLDKSEYGVEESKFIDSVQQAALEFLNAVKKDMLFREELDISEDVIMSAYCQFAVHPDMSTLKLFNGFKVLNGRIRKMLPEHGILYYMIHPKELRQDFEENSCKIFFLKKLLKVKIPYYEMLKFLLLKWNIRRE